MKKIINKLFLIMVVAGIILGIGGFSDAMLIMKGKTLNLNEAEQTDFEEAALIEGKINFVYGPFATLEETETTYGVVTKKTDTDFYVVGNFDAETYMEYYNGGEEIDDFYVIFSTSNPAKQAVLDMASERWVEYLNEGYLTNPNPPEITIEFEGKLTNQSEDDDYISFRKAAIDDLANAGIKDYQYATLRIADGKVENTSLYIFFGGIALFIIGIIGFIWSFISARKQKKANLDFINSSYSEY